MRNQLALVALASQVAALAVPPPLTSQGGAIIDGEAVRIEDYPYQVDLRVRDEQNCGGTIISDRYVLTAAHCTLNYRGLLNIRVGSATNGRGTRYNVTKAVEHPKYKDRQNPYDAAILEISPRIKFGTGVQAIPLADVEPAVGTVAVVSGWGTVTPGRPDYATTLQAVKVPIYDHNTCKNDYARIDLITPDMICAGYPEGKKDSCQGDSGGPLVAGGKVVGVVSWGEGCAQPKLPGVYSSVASAEIRSFIKDTTGLPVLDADLYQRARARRQALDMARHDRVRR
ncbi:trypsin-like serine protease [Cordyceps fumosorosea ARSEF 2679]|uniref:Trypsin-like serine protease n=1 Tax=Cordyceps fumosorosea (strain ARSEF 2679) TaxID=1081104 RepID=A0A162IHB0_CORFA|nr:trypsin-like serine protease [Cordyceps fumosorosea ARSEF 2679]OAA57155.1 trypsin-like serine protease [Cordyceps fumosorosea ARSEF 2679]